MRRSQIVVGLCALFLGCGEYGTEESLNDGEQVDTEGSYILAGKRLSEATVVGHLRSVGFPERYIPTMVCTAKWESSFYEGARHPNRKRRADGTVVTVSTDWGLFQINDRPAPNGPGWLSRCGVTTNALLNAEANARCAKMVFEEAGNSFLPWYGYQKHRTECNNYRVDMAGVDESFEGSQRQCKSATLDELVPSGSCVQASGDSLWYQCRDGAWSTSASTPTNLGECTVSYPIGTTTGRSCFSKTQGDYMNHLSCVQGASDGIWYQCKDGNWFQGVTNRTGAGGACVGYYPI